MPLQGSLDNRYEVKRSLGRGGMAEVYLARDRVLDRDVALKILSRCYAEDAEFVRRFRREARSAASLTHPNVVSIHDLGEVEGEDGEPPTYYIAMEYVEGISLRELLEQEVRLSRETAVSIACQIAEGLAAAHEQGIVHRDIKPHNILLSETVHAEYPGEGRGGVKVADFGIARAASTATSTEGILGTAHYLSPEQAMGAEATSQSDLYSLGVVLYEMLTGRRPYDAESPFGVAMRHVTGDLRPPKEILPDLPGELNSIVVRLLGKDPEERHADAEELLEDLESLSARPAPREALSGGERRRQESTGLLVPICALILLVASLWGAQQGFGLSSLAGVNPGDLRSGVEQILDGEPPRDGGASRDGAASPQPGPAAEAPGGATEQDSASGEKQKENGAGGEETREEPSGSEGAAEEGAVEEGAAGEEPEGSNSEEGSSDSSDDGSPENGATENGAEDSAPEGGSPQSVPGASQGGSEEASPGEPSGDESSGGEDSGYSGGGEEQLIYVPDLAGQTLETARSALQSTGFEVAGVVEQPGQAAEGTVLYADPAAGSAWEPGTGVTLTVSSGAQPPASGGEEPAPPGDESGGSTGGSDDEDTVSVPDVTGRQSEQAVMILESAGLRAEVSGAFGDEDSGTVVDMDPPAGSTVEEGTTVTLTVTDGPQTAAAPVDEKPANDQYQYEDRASEPGER